MPGLLGVSVLGFIGHSPHLPTFGEHEHADDGETDDAGGNANNGERVGASLLLGSTRGLLSSGRGSSTRIGLGIGLGIGLLVGLVVLLVRLLVRLLLVLLIGLIGVLLVGLVVLGLGLGRHRRLGRRLMTRGDSAAGLLALRAGAGTRARASTGTVASATVATISARTAIAARVNSILGPLGIQRQIGRHRRTEVIRLRASLIGEPTAESVAIARRIGRLDQLAVGRSHKLSVANRPAVGIKGNRPRLNSPELEQRTRIIDVVEVARSIGNDRRVTVLVMASRIINLRRLCVAKRIAIHATASREVDVILAIRAVHGEVHIGLAALNTHQRSSSNTVEASRQRLAVGSSDHRGLTRLQVIENQSRARSRLSADNQIVTRHRWGAQIIRKAQINRLLFTQHTLRRKRNHMELSVVRHLIEGRTIGRIGNAIGICDSAELHGRNDIASRLINALKRARARRNNGVLIRQRSASPIIALGRVNVLPRDFARGNLDTLQGAVAVGRVVVLVIRNIDRTNIDILAVRNDGAGALRQVRQTS